MAGRAVCMAYMRFEFILKTDSDDYDYETARANELVERILGWENVFHQKVTEILPEGYDPFDATSA